MIWRTITLLLAALTISQAAMAGGDGAPKQASLSPGSAQTGGAQLPRYGLNLGGTTYWGAEQLRANVLGNPGFEGLSDGALMKVRTTSPDGAREDTDWIRREEGFWVGASATVLTGEQAGETRRVLDYRIEANGTPAYRWSAPLPRLQRGDLIALARTELAARPPRWWAEGQVGTGEGRRPGGSGAQTVRLIPAPGQPARLHSHLDTIGDRAGRLLPVGGAWRFSIWLRGRPGSALSVRFARDRALPLIDRRVQANDEWQQLEIAFGGTEQAGGHSAGALKLSLEAVGGEIELDDAYLGEASPGAGGFRRAVVDTVRHLRPGYLRDWQGQLGDRADNRLAGDFARQPVRYRPGPNETLWLYGLPDFLALCAEVDARPWIVLPTTLTRAEARQLGTVLAAQRSRHGFDEMLVEFGNENWNPLFSPAGIPDPMAHAEAAGRVFSALRQGYGQAGGLIAVVNARLSDPEAIARLATSRNGAQRIAVAPYFAYRLEAGQAWGPGLLAEAAPALLDAASRASESGGLRLAAYELNLHTTMGTAPEVERNSLVAGAASGTLLATQLLRGTLAGLREQAVYSLSGYDTRTSGGLARLFGVTRDLAASNRLRPTGHALAMLNALPRGNARTADCMGSACTALTALVIEGTGLAWAVTSLADAETRVGFDDACQAGVPVALVLDGSDPVRDNEFEAQVQPRPIKVDCHAGEASVLLPPRSLVTLVVTRSSAERR